MYNLNVDNVRTGINDDGNDEAVSVDKLIAIYVQSTLGNTRIKVYV